MSGYDSIKVGNSGHMTCQNTLHLPHYEVEIEGRDIRNFKQRGTGMIKFMCDSKKPYHQLYIWCSPS